MRLSKLVKSVEGGCVVFEGEWDREISALSADSRKSRKNSLFFCIKGENTDSHLLAKEAVKNGAVAIVTERELLIDVPQLLVKDTRTALGVLASVFYGEPSKDLKVIGITGTNGKTTVSYMLASILKSAGKSVGIIGTLGAVYGRKKFSTELTTPDPIELNRIFADMLVCGMEYAVMEVSAHALHYHKTAGVEFCAGVFTNLTQDHLDFFEDMTAYKSAKSSLFLPTVCPIAILNGDDEVGREFGAMRGVQGKTLYYGLQTPCDAFAVLTDEGLQGTECLLNIDDKLSRITLAMVGKHNIYNALSAAACASALGISVHAISHGLTQLKGVEGRLQWVGKYNDGEIFVDFAHTPDGLSKCLDALRPYCKGRLITLFGCGGNRDKSKRAPMGETVAKKADFAVLTSDNPRYEDPLDIICEIEKGYRRYSVRYVVVPDRKRAIEYALEFMKKGDILLVAGKGSEEYQEVMGIKYPFKDQDTIENLLEKKGK